MRSNRFSCWQFLLLVLFMHLTMVNAVNAAFGGFMPLSFSGRLAYNYTYVSNNTNESETTTLQGSVNAAGYVWRPWFATTSLALNLGVSNTETSTSSSDSTSSTGSFNLGVFPSSRFPFSLSYSRSDSQSESYYDLTQLSGEVRSKVTRLSLRQAYRPQRGNQSYDGWYYVTDFDGQSFESKSTAYGLNYQKRMPKQNFKATSTHSESETIGSAVKPKTDLISVSHVYTPGSEVGLNSLGSYVKSDTGYGGASSINSQLASSFSWRPESRSLGVSGGVRLSESKSEGGSSQSTVLRSMNTNLGLNYRITRALNMSANAAVGVSDNNGSDSLITNQTLGMSYRGDQRNIAGLTYSWSGSATVANTTNELNSGGVKTKTDSQSVGAGLGHGVGNNWSVGDKSSMSMNLAQSGSASKSSELDVITKSISHSGSMSWNRRGASGSTNANTQISDSRSFGETDSAFQRFGFSLAQNWDINRQSQLNGNMSYQADRTESDDGLGGQQTGGSRAVNGTMAYGHGRPFGVYNLRFSSTLVGARQIDSAVPTTTLRWDGKFQYQLGLLSTSLTFKAAQGNSGPVAKSMSFRATRSF